MSEKAEEKKVVYSMFHPSSKRSLFTDHPELKKAFDSASHTKASNYSRGEMLFVWFYGCRLSPFYHIEEDRKKIKECLDASIGRKMFKPDFERWMSGNFPEKIRLGIEIMEGFQPGPRIRAKKMVEQMIEDLEIMVAEAKPKKKSGEDEEDFQKRRESYAKMAQTVTKTLPDLIKQAEGGFGISELEDGEMDDLIANGMIDDWHEQQ